MSSSFHKLLISTTIAFVLLTIVFAGGITVSASARDSQSDPVNGITYRVGPPSGADDASVADVSTVITSNCRYGLTGGSELHVNSNWLMGQNIGLGTYLDFSAHGDTSTLPGAEYFKVIRILQDRVPDGAGGYIYQDSYHRYSSYYNAPNSPMSDAELTQLVSQNRGSLW